MLVKLLCENANTMENVIPRTSEHCLERRSLNGIIINVIHVINIK